MKKKWLYILPTIFIISLVCGTLFYFTALILPPPIINQSYVIKYLDNNNNELFTTHYNSEGSYVELDKISPYIIAGYVVIEDKNFYSHNGLDITRILKAGIDNVISKGIVSGASTITQQLARTLYYDNQKTYTRKLKEAFMAARIEMHYNKKDILEYYLNSIYFGHGIHGVEDASMFYFGLHAHQLSIAQSAMLMGISNAPSHYSPLNNYNLCKQKQKSILYKLYKSNIITAQEYNNAIEEKIEIFGIKVESSHISSYYKDSIISYLKKLGIYTKENLVKGLSIKTTFDYNISTKINNILQYYKNNQNQVSVIVMEPNTNYVLSLFGGWDYEESSYNRAINSQRQIASTIKPLIYYLALNSGFTPTTKLTSEPTTFFIKNYGEYTPSNNNDIYANDKITMINALGTSDNIYATKTALLVGLDNIIDLLRTFNVHNVDKVPSLALGSASTTPITLANIYNTFASIGRYSNPIFITEVKDSYGNLLYKHKDNSYQMLNENETLILNQLLRAPFDKNNKSYTSPTLLNYQTNHLYAAKTGTTDTDSWTVGYNPNYTILVWVGTDDNSPLTNASLSRKIFQDIANTIDSDGPSVWYETNNSIKVKRVSPLTGSYSPYGSLYYFAKAWTSFTSLHLVDTSAKLTSSCNCSNLASSHGPTR